MYEIRSVDEWQKVQQLKCRSKAATKSLMKVLVEMLVVKNGKMAVELVLLAWVDVMLWQEW